MYREQQSTESRPVEFTAATVLAPVAVLLALMALMGLFLGTDLSRLAPLRELLLAAAAAAALWIVSVLVRPSLSARVAFGRLPAWCWVAGIALLTLAALAALSLVLAARLVETSLADPTLATATLALGVVAFWLGYGFAGHGGGATRFSGPRNHGND